MCGSNPIIPGMQVNGGFSVCNIILVYYLEIISGMRGAIITTVWELVFSGMLSVVITIVYLQ